MHFASGELEVYLRISSKLKLGIVGEDYTGNVMSPRQTNSEKDGAGSSRTGAYLLLFYK